MAYVPPHLRKQGSTPTGQRRPRCNKLSGIDDSSSCRMIQEIRKAFPQICCINLDRRTDKWEKIQRDANKIGLSSLLERVSAVDGEASGLDDDESGKEVNRKYISRALLEFGIKCKSPGPKVLTTSEVGCALSHIGLWRRQASSTQDGAMLILEDDASFMLYAKNNSHKSRFVAACAKALQILPSDYGIFYLGLSDRGERTYLDNDESGTNVGANSQDGSPNIRLYRPSYGYHTHAYAITTQAAQILLDNLPIVGPIDVWLADHGWFDIPTYCAVVAGEGWRFDDGTFEGRDLVCQDRRGLKNDIVHSCDNHGGQ